MIRRWAFIDCWSLISTIFREKKRFDDAEIEHESLRTFELTKAMLNQKEWQNAKAVLSRISKALATNNGQPAFHRIYFESLLPFGHSEWSRDPEFAKDYLTFHLPLVASPASWLYAGGGADNPPTGWLTYIDLSVKNCAVNFGEMPRIHLVVDIERPPPEIIMKAIEDNDKPTLQ